MRLLPLAVAVGPALIAAAVISPSGSAAQDPVPPGSPATVIGIEAEGNLDLNKALTGQIVPFDLVLYCKTDRAHANDQTNADACGYGTGPKAAVRYTVTAAARKKYALPSTTLAEAAFTEGTTNGFKTRASRAMSRALGKIKRGQKLTIKVTVAFKSRGGTTLANVSAVDFHYELVREPVVAFDI